MLARTPSSFAAPALGGWDVGARSDGLHPVPSPRRSLGSASQAGSTVVARICALPALHCRMLARFPSSFAAPALGGWDVGARSDGLHPVPSPRRGQGMRPVCPDATEPKAQPIGNTVSGTAVVPCRSAGMSRCGGQGATHSRQKVALPYILEAVRRQGDTAEETFLQGLQLVRVVRRAFKLMTAHLTLRPGTAELWFAWALPDGF